MSKRIVLSILLLMILLFSPSVFAIDGCTAEWGAPELSYYFDKDGVHWLVTEDGIEMFEGIDGGFYTPCFGVEPKIYEDKIQSQDDEIVEEEIAQQNWIREEELSFKGINIGDKTLEVEKTLGQPFRKDLSKYGFYWHIYNKDYNDYLQVGIENDQVVALYSNRGNWSSLNNFDNNTTRRQVKEALGEHLEWINKGSTSTFAGHREQNTYLLDGYYATFFYDLLDGESLDSILLVEQGLEEGFTDLHPPYTPERQASFERQVFDLTNVFRARNGLEPFYWSDSLTEVARKHSEDMAKQEHFDHMGLDGRSPFDRMTDAGIEYFSAGENIAMGQTNGIEAYLSWVNSAGHRANMLKDFEMLGVGVGYGGKERPYYTQKFYSGPGERKERPEGPVVTKDQEGLEKEPKEEHNPSGWAKADVYKANELGIVPESLLREYQSNATRKETAQLAVTLYEIFTEEEIEELDTNPFNDTDNPEVIIAYDLGIVRGTSSNTFSPNAPVTRQEMAVMMYRMLGLAIAEHNFDIDHELNFADTKDIAQWAKEAMTYMNGIDIMRGVGNDRVAPKQNITREQAIIMALRLYKNF